MGGLYSRLKTWVTTEDVTHSDLNAEFDNILTNFVPLMIDDYSTNTAQMQVQTDPGEVGTESLATTLGGEIARIRFMLKEMSGETYWYTSPPASLTDLVNSIGTGLLNNRLASGRVRTTSDQPIFLVPNGAARTVKLDGTPVNFVYYIAGVQYTISSDVTLTSLTAAPSSNNTCLVNDTAAADQYWTKYAGEDSSEIPVDTMGSEISGLVGKLAGFKLNNGSADEYFLAYVKSSTSLTKAHRGYFFDSADAPIPRIVYSNNDTITLMKLSWIYAKTDGTLTVSYTNPTYSYDEPSSPAANDYWFDLGNNIWKKYDVSSFVSAGATLVGVCLQDATNTVAARSFHFFASYSEHNSVEVFAESNSQVKSRFPGAEVAVGGTVHRYPKGFLTWDMALDLESGVTEASSTYYYFYVTEDGDEVISDQKPYDRKEDFQGYYHPHQSWRCVGWAFNNSSSNLEQVESYFRSRSASVTRSVIAADRLLARDQVNIFSGASHATTLPDAALCRGQEYFFYHGGTSTTEIYTLTPFAAQTIGGAANWKLYTNGEFAKIASDGSNWLLLQTNATIIATVTGNAASATSGNIIIFPSEDYDTHNAYDTGTGRFTCPIKGYYRVSGLIQIASTTATISIYKNAVAGPGIIAFGAETVGGGSGVIQCAAGDILDIRPNATVDATANSYITYEWIGI